MGIWVLASIAQSGSPVQSLLANTRARMAAASSAGSGIHSHSIACVPCCPCVYRSAAIVVRAALARVHAPQAAVCSKWVVTADDLMAVVDEVGLHILHGWVTPVALDLDGPGCLPSAAAAAGVDLHAAIAAVPSGVITCAGCQIMAVLEGCSNALQDAPLVAAPARGGGPPAGPVPAASSP